MRKLMLFCFSLMVAFSITSCTTYNGVVLAPKSQKAVVVGQISVFGLPFSKAYSVDMNTGKTTTMEVVEK